MIVRRLEGRTILLTGPAGFIGSAIIQQLAQTPCTIRRMLHVASGHPPPAGTVARIEDIEGDTRDSRAWEAAMPGVDIVIHLAAQTSVYTAAADPRADLAVNVESVLHAIEIGRTLARPLSIVAAGTATAVGLTHSTTPVNEDRLDRPSTFYDVHKWMAERYLEMSSLVGRINATTLRLTNVYGPGPAARSRDRGWLNAMIRRACEGEALTLYGSGDVVRDYVYVEDIARAFLAAAGHIEAVKGQHFLIGSGSGTTLAEAVRLVSARAEIATGRRAPVVSVEPPAGLSPIEERSFVADSRRFQIATGWRAAVGLEEGIDRTINSLRV